MKEIPMKHSHKQFNVLVDTDMMFFKTFMQPMQCFELNKFTQICANHNNSKFAGIQHKCLNSTTKGRGSSKLILVIFLGLVANLATRWSHFCTLITNLATRWRYLHQTQTWPPEGTTCINWKLGHQVTPLELVLKLDSKLSDEYREKGCGQGRMKIWF